MLNTRVHRSKVWAWSQTHESPSTVRTTRPKSGPPQGGITGPLAELEAVGLRAVDAAAQALGLSRRQVYVLIRRALHGNGLVTDLAPG